MSREKKLLSGDIFPLAVVCGKELRGSFPLPGAGGKGLRGGFGLFQRLGRAKSKGAALALLLYLHFMLVCAVQAGLGLGRCSVGRQTELDFWRFFVFEQSALLDYHFAVALAGEAADAAVLGNDAVAGDMRGKRIAPECLTYRLSAAAAD